jgi:hypothetical protein
MDMDRVLLDFARSNSISSAPIADLDPPPRHAINESIPSSVLDDCHAEMGNPPVPADTYNSGCVDISALRFWPMFVIIMIGYFVGAPDQFIVDYMHLIFYVDCML